MPRVLTAQRTVVTPAQRGRLLERLRARREYYQGAGCHYWVFEEIDLQGAFIEFIEAADAASLRTAIAAAPDDPGAVRFYQELELD
jgi:hypothetical protein